eukprot:CAMPEP_0180559020 /NCGR_PEP_ID=MMETSP1037_2-20121125/2068_1 /TAXON_ID=632150 /ORGANISM="Azadinium spinosum, Strain 3D9" /LENGTH=86 /DNA_ID=CAMNT_0022575453 /DNA_START=180 /DNA_END=437 /DNA_ORIENTATION=-
MTSWLSRKVIGKKGRVVHEDALEKQTSVSQWTPRGKTRARRVARLDTKDQDRGSPTWHHCARRHEDSHPLTVAELQLKTPHVVQIN